MEIVQEWSIIYDCLWKYNSFTSVIHLSAHNSIVWTIICFRHKIIEFEQALHKLLGYYCCAYFYASRYNRITIVEFKLNKSLFIWNLLTAP